MLSINALFYDSSCLTQWRGFCLSQYVIPFCKWAAARQNQQNDVRPAKTQISLGIRPVWLVFAVRSTVDTEPSFLHADSEDSDQTGRMPRMIRVFAERTGHFVGFVVRWLKCLECHVSVIYTSPAAINQKTW